MVGNGLGCTLLSSGFLARAPRSPSTTLLGYVLSAEQEATVAIRLHLSSYFSQEVGTISLLYRLEKVNLSGREWWW